MRRTNKHTKKSNLDWLDSFFTYINGRNTKKKKKRKNVNTEEQRRRASAYMAETAKENNEVDPAEINAEENRYGFDSGSYKFDEPALKEPKEEAQEATIADDPVPEEVVTSEEPAPEEEHYSDETAVIMPVAETSEEEPEELQENKKEKGPEPEVVVRSAASAKPLWE